MVHGTYSYHWFHVFPRLSSVICFPCLPLVICFPRLSSVICFPRLSSVICFPRLPLVHFFLRFQPCDLPRFPSVVYYLRFLLLIPVNVLHFSRNIFPALSISNMFSALFIALITFPARALHLQHVPAFSVEFCFSMLFKTLFD